MNIISHANIANTVSKYHSKVKSEVIFLNRDWEIKGVMVVDVQSFVIINACWDIIKSPQESFLGLETICFPERTTGYIDGKKAIKKMVTEKNGKLKKYIMSQCINGIIQGETYIYQERGFKDRDSYNLYWDQIEANGCRMFSNPDPSDLKWMDYVPKHNSKVNLFNRFKSVKIIDQGDCRSVQGAFSDTYHELYVEIDYRHGDGEIISSDIQYIRAPGAACYENSNHKHALADENIDALKKDVLINCLGGAQGCYHLVDIAVDIINEVQNNWM